MYSLNTFFFNKEIKNIHLKYKEVQMYFKNIFLRYKETKILF